MNFARRFKEKNKKGFLITIIQIFLIICIIVSLSYIIKWFKENNKSKNIKMRIDKAISVDTTNNYKIDFNMLEETNSDVVAWLIVKNTNINYPIVKTNNNDYYLNHSFDKIVNSAGWIFADYKNKFNSTDKNIVIYGHNRKDQSMFGSLNRVLKKDWYEKEENHTIDLITKDGELKYKVFSVYQIENEEYYIKTSFSNNEDFKQFIKTIKSRSIYNFNTEVDENSQILTLSTCGASSKSRVVLHAKLIED